MRQSRADQIQTISFDETAQTEMKGFRNRTYLVDYSFVKSTSFNRIVRYPNNWPAAPLPFQPPPFIIHFTNGTRARARRSSFYREFNFYPIRWSDLWSRTRQDLRADTQSAYCCRNRSLIETIFSLRALLVSRIDQLFIILLFLFSLLHLCSFNCIIEFIEFF